MLITSLPSPDWAGEMRNGSAAPAVAKLAPLATHAESLGE